MNAHLVSRQGRKHWGTQRCITPVIVFDDRSAADAYVTKKNARASRLFHYTIRSIKKG